MDALAKVCAKCGRRYDAIADFCQKDGSRLQLAEERRDPYIGQTLLDQFKIEEKIGAGGMGSVYRARQRTLDRDVAIKILHPELANNHDAVRRFKREARVCTALDHPNVVRVFLFGQLKDGSLYIVMEHLKGRSLLDVIRSEGALPVHRALHVATQICDGVGEAHAQGVVHRDLKPENVVLVEKARDPDFVKVLDFGIARVLWGDDQTHATTQSGLVFGTARYISPEGAAGESTDVRSDVYSLGVISYQLLCGETPFDAPSPVAMLMKHIHTDPPHLLGHSRARHVPDAVADVVMRALSKNPEGRYDDAHAYADALRAAAVRAGFEVTGASRASSGIRPPGSVQRGEASARFPIDKPPAVTVTPQAQLAEPTPSLPRVESSTLQGAPSPFGDEDAVVAGLASPARERGFRRLGMAFAIGAALVLVGFGVQTYLEGRAEAEHAVDVEGLATRARDALGTGAYDAPPGSNVLELTTAILEAEPEHAEARRMRAEVASRLARLAASELESGRAEQAQATYRRALAFTPGDAALQAALEAAEIPMEPPPPPGLRVRPTHVVEGREVTLVAVLEPGIELADDPEARFQIRRGSRRVGRSIPATLSEDGHSWEAAHTIARSGDYFLTFRIGRGREVTEQRVALEVHRDPDRPIRRRPVNDDPPPVTTQGNWPAPTIAPAWTPTPPANQDPAPPPEPWTGGQIL
ncbi:MAG: protein kinase [Sandaracinaceae bacterium]